MYQYILVEHANDLNEQIQKPIQQSQRIKFTCLDVSTNYIVFGASSGGIYIYQRKPYAFIKILPTKEGAIDQLSISIDECFVALSNQKGLIIIIENCFTEQDVKFQVYNQHDNKITVLKWHSHELYSGDINGRVCVTPVKNILTKSLFQIPFSTLMHLDSPIVQIDCYLHYLLISTLTKTLLCNTAHEQYRQIGKKAREGQHGACFQNLPKEILNSSYNHHRQESHSSYDNIVENIRDVRIFCSRPGLRLWQVDFDTSVTCTHQFKNAKSLEKCMFKITDEKNCRAIKNNINQENTENENILNFYRIHLLKCNLMLTSNDNTIYILKVTDSKVTLLYKLRFNTHIQDIRIVDNTFYILLNNWVLRSFSIYDLETYIIYTLKMEQYLLCADICVEYKDNICDMFEQSESLHVLSTLKANLDAIEEINFPGDLEELLELINSKNKVLSTNTNGIIASPDKSNDSPKNGSNLHSNDEIMKFDDDEFCVTVIIKQFKLHLQYNVDYPDYTELLEHKSTVEIMSLFESIRIKEQCVDFEPSEFIDWSSKQFLNLVPNKIAAVSNNTLLKHYLVKCFRNINYNSDTVCKKCKYPLPTAKDTLPNYYHLICDILKADDVAIKEVAMEVPYMWKYLLECGVKFESIGHLLPTIIQFSDITILEQYSSQLNYDLWDEAVKLMIKIKSKLCLNCDNMLEIDVASTMNWQAFANVAIRVMNATNALKLFMNHVGFISNAELGPEFYQNFIFVAAMDNAGKDRGASAQIFDSAMADESHKIEMEALLANFLNNAFLQKNNHSHLDISPISSLKNILSNKL